VVLGAQGQEVVCHETEGMGGRVARCSDAMTGGDRESESVLLIRGRFTKEHGGKPVDGTLPKWRELTVYSVQLGGRRTIKLGC